ncbi:MAG: bestrophin-like domain [Methylobacter sp.]
MSPTLWHAVFFSGWLSIIMIYFFAYPCVRLHTTMAALMSAFIGLPIFLIVDMAWPFCGELSVSPEPLQLILDKMSKQHKSFRYKTQ